MLFTALLLAMAPAATLLNSVSSARNDYNLSLDAAERRMVFARSDADFANAQIYIAERRGSRWSTPVPISFSDPRFADSDPWLTPDGRTLFFISDRPAPGRELARKDYDIWRSQRVGGRWSAPVRLGPNVNGAGQEMGPELHAGILTFSSGRRSGRGGLDIFQARARGADFDKAELLPGPFNTAANESDFTLSPDGKTAMFWRSIGERGVIYIATRLGTGWSQPTPLPADINIGSFNFTPSFSRDGRTIRFASTAERPGQPSGLADVYERPLPRR